MTVQGGREGGREGGRARACSSTVARDAVVGAVRIVRLNSFCEGKGVGWLVHKCVCP